MMGDVETDRGKKFELRKLLGSDTFREIEEFLALGAGEMTWEVIRSFVMRFIEDTQIRMDLLKMIAQFEAEPEVVADDGITRIAKPDNPALLRWLRSLAISQARETVKQAGDPIAFLSFLAPRRERREYSALSFEDFYGLKKKGGQK